MDRRGFLKTVGIGSSIMVTRTFSKNKNDNHKANKPGNVILYVVDDQGTGDAGCYGNPVVNTPGLDYLAENGTRFENAFCTTASCSPSRSVILSGLHSHANGMFGLNHAVHNFQSFENFESLPMRLSDNGYRTLSAGKYHVSPEETYKFDQRISFNWAQNKKGEWYPGDTPEQLAEKCKNFIDADNNQPFFVYFCTYAPHRPFWRQGAEKIEPEDVIVPDYLPDIPECREELAKYYMSIEKADAGLVKLIEILKETGHWEDTLIIYISDNGSPFPGGKTTVYEPGIKLPCVVRDPAAGKKGIVSNAMISWTDIMPTILEYAGIEYETNKYEQIEVPEYIEFNNSKPSNEKLHGSSFLSLLSLKNPEGWDEIYASHSFHEVYMYYPMRVVREQRFKLIWNIAHRLQYPMASDLYHSKTWQAVLDRNLEDYGKRKIEKYLHRAEFELYDLKTDPDETENLADSPDFKDKFEELKRKLKAFQVKTEDRWINKWTYK